MARLTGRLVQGAIIGGIAAALALACSASSGGSHFGDGTGSGGSGSSSSGGGGAGIAFGGSSNGGSGSGGYSYNLPDGSSSTGGAGGNGLGGDACAATHSAGKQMPLDMYIMMDESGSMDGTKWNGVKSALTSFVNAGAPVAGVGVGIQFFPPPSSGTGCVPAVPPCGAGCIPIGPLCFPTGSTGGAECDPQTYLPPAVMIQPLPDVAQKIIDAMNTHSPNGGTPTLPAMQSAVQATTKYAQQHPDHKVIIVLATDGDPNDCKSTVANVSAEAAQALSSKPSVMTFVIGIGTVSSMDQIAQAGGSSHSYQVDAANANQTFLKAMNDIRGTALGCDYLLPKPSNGGTLDPSKVNVVYTPQGGKGQLVYGVHDASKCGSTSAWYYDVPPDKGTPTKIILCPSTCSQVKNSGGAVDIQLGCSTVPPPVH